MLSEVGKAYQALSWLVKSNKFRLKIVTKVNGKDVLKGQLQQMVCFCIVNLILRFPNTPIYMSDPVIYFVKFPVRTSSSKSFKKARIEFLLFLIIFHGYSSKSLKIK